MSQGASGGTIGRTHQTAGSGFLGSLEVGDPHTLAGARRSAVNGSSSAVNPEFELRRCQFSIIGEAAITALSLLRADAGSPDESRVRHAISDRQQTWTCFNRGGHK